MRLYSPLSGASIDLPLDESEARGLRQVFEISPQVLDEIESLSTRVGLNRPELVRFAVRMVDALFLDRELMVTLRDPEGVIEKRVPPSPRVFVSYAREDVGFVAQLDRELTARGISVWRDEHSISVGEGISEKIESALRGADNVIVVLSEHSMRSEWCQYELGLGVTLEAERKRPFVLPVRIDGCELQPEWKERHCLDAKRDDHAAVADALAREIHQLPRAGRGAEASDPSHRDPCGRARAAS